MFCRREAIVAFRQISSGKEYQFFPGAGTLARNLDYRLYSGIGIESLDYIKCVSKRLEEKLTR